jgi:hypothetical protein
MQHNCITNYINYQHCKTVSVYILLFFTAFITTSLQQPNLYSDSILNDSTNFLSEYHTKYVTKPSKILD